MSGTRMRRYTLACAIAALVVTVTGCEPSGSDATGEPSAGSSVTPSHSPASPKPTDTAHGNPSPTASQPPASEGTALAALNTLPVKGKAPMTGYDRDQFGTEWDDSVGTFPWSRNGCDTRNDVLARDLQRETVEQGGCDVANGILAYDPYSGATNYYFDSTDDEYETDLDIDHVVALGNVWITGGQLLSPDKRAEIANDPMNLLAVNPSLNRQKGDADAATWLPPNKSFRCSYVARQVAVKQKYHLWVTAPEKAAIERILAACPNEPLAQDDPQEGHKASGDVPTPAATSSPSPSAKPAGGTPGGGQGGAVYYANCDAVRAAGAAPIHRGDPGYSTSLDRDGDGTACE